MSQAGGCDRSRVQARRILDPKKGSAGGGGRQTQSRKGRNYQGPDQGNHRTPDLEKTAHGEERKQEQTRKVVAEPWKNEESFHSKLCVEWKVCQ